MNVLMLTLMYPKDQLDEITKNAVDKLQNQINNYQWAFVEGIRASLSGNEKLCILNCLPVGIFPSQYRKLFLQSGWHDNKTIQQIGCINLPFFKQKMRERSAKKAIEKWYAEDTQNRTVLVYTQYLPYLRALQRVRRSFPDLKTAVIVTDLPNEMGLATGRKGIWKKIESSIGRQSIKLLRQMDGFILLTKPMTEALQIWHKPFKVIEGLILSDVQSPKAPTPDEPYFLYTGTLESGLGIAELIEAFEQMPEYNLWICGNGNMAALVKQYASRCPNIRFLGFVPQKEALAMQANAVALINPRQPSGVFTRYSFPSKTLEYMRAAKPVLCCKLEGIPDEYDAYLNYMSEGSNGIIQAVRALMESSEEERKRIGESCRSFVLEQKNPQVQCKKLLALLRKL